MTIFCAICKRGFHSTKSLDQAQKDVMEQMAQDLTTGHKQEVRDLAESFTVTTQALATYLMIRRYVTIPESEAEFLRSFETTEASLLELFGFEHETAEKSD